MATGECRRVLEGHTDRVYGVAFAPDASRLATASYDKTARIWSVADGRVPADLQGAREGGPVRCLEPRWNPPGHRRLRSVDQILEPGRNPLSKHRESGQLDYFRFAFTADSSELLYTWGGPGGHAGRLGGPAGLLGTGAGAIHQA